MYVLLIILHVFVCLVLIAVILLQAGRGGGLTQAFGGDSAAESLLGTRAPEALKKATEVAAVIFLVTSLSLAMITARRGRSLFHGMPFPEAAERPFEAMPGAEVPLGPIQPETLPGEHVAPEVAPEEMELPPQDQDIQ